MSYKQNIVWCGWIVQCTCPALPNSHLLNELRTGVEHYNWSMQYSVNLGHKKREGTISIVSFWHDQLSQVSAFILINTLCLLLKGELAKYVIKILSLNYEKKHKKTKRGLVNIRKMKRKRNPNISFIIIKYFVTNHECQKYRGKKRYLKQFGSFSPYTNFPFGWYMVE